MSSSGIGFDVVEGDGKTGGKSERNREREREREREPVSAPAQALHWWRVWCGGRQGKSAQEGCTVSSAGGEKRGGGKEK